MKKNISINIGGIIFHIEEDGYEKLQNYLESIGKYFSTFEESKEIIEDIESRIAEIFLSKLNEVNQVISLIDVEEVISTMGTIQDFDATIETDPLQQEPEQAPEPEENATTESSETDEAHTPRKLVRDQRRKIFGGVASGIAHYFGVDPIWIRLLFIGLLINVFFGGLSAFTFLSYVVLWIVLPSSSDLEDDQRFKKLFRNKEGGVLGGVASGLAAYFGLDRSVVRLLFVLSIFLGGSGIIIYLILWIIMPVAKTITEKMQMEGEPVTLSNIEENVKRKVSGSGNQENALTKILLFPFRLISTILTGIGKLLGPSASGLAEVIRVFAGVLVALVGFCLMIVLLVSFLVIVGWLPTWWATYVNLGDFPLSMAISSLTGFVAFSAFLVAFVPALSLALLGTFLLLKRSVGKRYIGWSLFGVWMIAVIGLLLFLPPIIDDFEEEGIHREERTFPVTAEVPTLVLNDQNWTDYDDVKLKLRGHIDSLYKLELRFEARGTDRRDAKENAKAVDYIVWQEASDFIFDAHLTFPENTPFRFQEVEAIFYIPEGKTFRMETSLRKILSNTLALEGYRSYQLDDNDWAFLTGRLKCLTCESDDTERSPRFRMPQSKNGEQVAFDYDNFDEIRISSFFNLTVEESSDYKVVIEASGSDLDDISVRKIGEAIEIKHKDHDWGWWEHPVWDSDISIFITMPDLETLDLSGACQAEVNGFNNDEIYIKLRGASELNANLSPEYLEMELLGASKVTLSGNAKRMEASIIGASKLDAFSFRTAYAELVAKGASNLDVYVTEELNADAKGISSIRYKGDPRVYADEKGMSTIRRY